MTANFDPTKAGPIGQSLAGGFVVASLLDLLIKKNVLTNSEVRDVLQRAMNASVHFPDSGIGSDVGRAIADLFPLFPENHSAPRT